MKRKNRDVFDKVDLFALAVILSVVAASSAFIGYNAGRTFGFEECEAIIKGFDFGFNESTIEIQEPEYESDDSLVLSIAIQICEKEYDRSSDEFLECVKNILVMGVET